MRLRAIILSLSILVLTAVGCSGSDSSDSSAATGEDTTAEADTAESTVVEADGSESDTRPPPNASINCPTPDELLEVFDYEVNLDPPKDEAPPGGIICNYSSIDSSTMVFVDLMVAPLNEEELAAAWQDAYDAFAPCEDVCEDLYADGTADYERFENHGDYMVAYRTSPTAESQGAGVVAYARSGNTLCFGFVLTSAGDDVDADAQRDTTVEYVRSLCS